MSGAPDALRRHSIPEKIFSPRFAKSLASDSWFASSTLTAKEREARTRLRVWERFSRETRISGGSSDTDANEVAVIPCTSPFDATVTIVMPLANFRRERL